MSGLKMARRRVLAGAVAGVSIPVLFLAQGALAQSQAQSDQTAGEEIGLEEIIVTGSRIKRTNLTSPNPVTVVDSTQILASGETDISTLLREIPALHSSLPANQSDQNGAPSGVGLLNLRGLGTERTLVLVNGRRHVAGVQGTASVDVSTIPVALIDRIETPTGGVSAIYGADGVSGVVNFILKDDFEGLDYRAQGGITDDGDGAEYFLSATGGFNFDDGRGNAVVNVEYTHNDKINVADRKFAG
ncbi:MAG: TonB-dependent receptor, partial [Alphaproteobacteria bacterium]